MEDQIARNEQIAKHKEKSLRLCNQLINELNITKDDADLFFGGELYSTYISATERVIEKANSIQSKLRNK